YLEHDPVAPLNVYGDSKASAEGTVRAALSSALIVRTSAFFSPWDRYNFITLALQTLARGERFRAAEDWIISPTYLPELIDACLDLLIDGEEGLWHLANRGAVSWAALARQAAARFGLDPSLVEGVSGSELRLPARRPAYSALESARGSLLSSLDQALERYHRELLHRPDAAGVAALSV
ncbi:MAG TPA: sugar nucleotide-binding protein, partial [Myxococcaceae bacterium]|nr:sugar nucleotide-binding protein [Myxococcaceae bacterium]